MRTSARAALATFSFLALSFASGACLDLDFPADDDDDAGSSTGASSAESGSSGDEESTMGDDMPGTSGNDSADGTTSMGFGSSTSGWMDGSTSWDSTSSGGWSSSWGSSSTGSAGQWTCPLEFYGTGDGCDCGCGVVDPDCSSEFPDACEYCEADGACVQGACEDVLMELDPFDNSQCVF